jgi:hypothetical protein
MRGCFSLLTTALLISSGLRSEQTSAPAAKPASSDGAAQQGSAPSLLLLDDEPAAKSAGGPVADNSRCQVCHLNMVTEDMAAKHAKANVGCAKCHGESDSHIADESWASGGNGTAPEIMYPKSKIASGCMECHKAEQVFVKAEKHKPDAWAIAYEEKLCTECHGQHHLPSRKCKWK